MSEEEHKEEGKVVEQGEEQESIEDELKKENAKFEDGAFEEEDTMVAVFMSAPKVGCDVSGKPLVLSIISPMFLGRTGTRCLASYARAADALRKAYCISAEEGQEKFWKALATGLLEMACKQLWPEETPEHYLEQRQQTRTLSGEESKVNDKESTIFDEDQFTLPTTKKTFDRIADVVLDLEKN